VAKSFWERGPRVPDPCPLSLNPIHYFKEIVALGHDFAELKGVARVV
jgi:hypothetical protein